MAETPFSEQAMAETRSHSPQRLERAEREAEGQVSESGEQQAGVTREGERLLPSPPRIERAGARPTRKRLTYPQYPAAKKPEAASGRGRLHLHVPKERQPVPLRQDSLLRRQLRVHPRPAAPRQRVAQRRLFHHQPELLQRQAAVPVLVASVAEDYPFQINKTQKAFWWR